MTFFKTLCLIAVCFWVSGTFAQTKLYVSPDGLNGKFTINEPGNLNAARHKVQELSTTMSENIEIVLLKGDYKLDSPLVFGKDDSGRNGHRIVYKAKESGTVCLSGGKQISGWTNTGNGIYKAKWNGNGFRQLYVNGARAIRARTPNRDNEETYGPYYRITGWDAKDKSISVRAKDIEQWDALCDVEMVIKKHWNQNRMRIEQFEKKGKEARIYFQEPETNIDAWTKGCCPGFDDNQTYYFENSIEFLDAPGEWFLDHKKNEIFYMPHEGEVMNTVEVVAPVLESLIELDGASNITFEGLIFEHTSWDMPDSARIGIQAGWRKDYDRTFIPGGIQVVNSHHLAFKGNIIRHFGGAGIEYLHSTHDNLIEGNLITDISGNGIQMYIDIKNHLPRKENMCRNEVIRNNYVIKTACEYTGNCGITATYVKNILIEHNEVADLPYTGISIGWGWTDSITGLQNNTIRYNKIHHTGQLHDDGAPIYSLSKSPGSVYYENYLYEVRKSEWAGNYTYGGLYLDNGSAAILLRDNVIQNVEVHPMVAWNPPNHSNTFEGNFYTDIGKLKIREGNTLKNNIPIKNDKWPEKALEIMEFAGPKIPKPVCKK